MPAAIIAMTAPHLMEQADEDGFKPIHLAVIQGSLDTVNLLLANKVDITALDNEGWCTCFWVLHTFSVHLKINKNCSLSGHSVVHWATG